MHLAANKGWNAVVRTLLHNNANINAANEFGGTPLHYAVDNGCEAVVNTLLANHANVNTTVTFDDMPLHSAAARGNEAVVRILLANNAIVKENCSGRTPIHYAVEHDHENVAKLLLQYVPDLTTLSNHKQIYNYPKLTYNRLEILIRQEAERRRWEALREMQQFLLASHPRLGQDSPAHVLSQHLFKEIYEQLRKTIKNLAVSVKKIFLNKLFYSKHLQV